MSAEPLHLLRRALASGRGGWSKSISTEREPLTGCDATALQPNRRFAFRHFEIPRPCPLGSDSTFSTGQARRF